MSGERPDLPHPALGSAERGPLPGGEGKDPWEQAAPRAIVVASATLAALGILFVFSSTAAEGESAAASSLLLRRQLLWVTLGALAMLLGWQTETRALLRLRRWIYGAALLGLALVLIPGVGTEAGGAHRWLRMGGGLGCQPSEAMKLALVILVAGEVAARRERVREFRAGFLPLFLPVALACGLTAAEPDLGTTSLTFAIGVVVLVTGGVRLLHLGLVGAPLILGAAGYLYHKFAYIQARVMVFLDPDLDPFGAGYQIRQCLFAMASGGLEGRGLGCGRQKILHLPHDHNDFILAVVGEETGLFGTALVAALFFLLLWGGIRAARRAPNVAGLLAGTGITFGIALQAAINMAVATASMPSKGIPLPLVSFGGSSMLVTGAALGILLRIAEDGARGAPGKEEA